MMELTQQEKADVELYRTYDESGFTKAVCHRLRSFKIKMLDLEQLAKRDTDKLRELKSEKANCFCSKADRRVFRALFYEWYDRVAPPGYDKQKQTEDPVEPGV